MNTAVFTQHVLTGIKKPFDRLSDTAQCYHNLDAWQIGEIGKALTEADADDFATDVEIATVKARYAG